MEEVKSVTEIVCPKCGSKQISTKEKGFNLAQAIAGGLIFGWAGSILAGMVGSKKIKVFCINCGTEWDMGKKE